MSLLCPNVCRLCVPNIMSLDICFKNCTSSKLAHLFDTTSKFALFSVFGLNEKVDKKQTYMKNEICKLYSRVFWIFLPNIIKVDPYNFDIGLPFQSSVIFETQCMLSCVFQWDIWYKEWHGSGTGGITAVLGPKYAGFPWGWGPVLRYYRGYGVEFFSRTWKLVECACKAPYVH